MPDRQAAHRGEPIAIVGLACRFPDASDSAELLDVVLSQRRAFRRLPPGRLGLALPGNGEDRAGGPAAGPPAAGQPAAGRDAAGERLAGGGPGAGASGQDGNGAARPASPPPGQPAYSQPAVSPRAALIEGWRFDRAAFGVTRPVYQATDPAHWLALETAARALADGGFPGGQGLSRDRTGVIIGNTLTGEVSRAAALRSRWPYVQRVITSALDAEQFPQAGRDSLLAQAEARFVASFPEPGEATLTGSLPSVIADRICGYFGFRGGGHAVDSAHSSSLLAVAAACSALATGDLDAAVAGGVDISLDPFELAGLADMGVLADREMRVYDARPTGFWPGEGCGMVVLMRAADARAAGLPSYAQIAGWGTSSAGNPALTRPGSGSLLLALRRAYQRAGVDPADVQFIEGDGTATASGDLAELTSLAEIREGAATMAAIGSVKANIGHTKAAAGAAGLVKAALVTAAGVIPPVTGCTRPHPLIASEEARLRVPRAPELWPPGTRLAAVSAVGPGGTSVHLVLRRDTGSGPRRRVRLPAGYLAAGAPRQQARPGPAGPAPHGLSPAGQPEWSPAASGPAVTAPALPPAVEAFVFSGRDREQVSAELNRVAALAPWLSDAEVHDLACQLGTRAAGAGPVRAAVVAGAQDELAARAAGAAALLRGLRPGRLAAGEGVYAADCGHGRVTLLFPGDGAMMAGPPGPARGQPPRCDPAMHPAVLAASLASLRLLGRLGVTAAAGVGHGVGEITALVWAGCLTEPDALRLVAQRSALLAEAPAEQAALVCVQADAPAALALCTGTGLAIAACNGPRCQVLAGPAGAARELARRAAAGGVPATLLEAPLALHTAALADRTAPLRVILREFAFRPPTRRLVSTVTGRDLTASDDIPALLCSQLVSPVRFTTALSLAAAGADLLVEAGPGRALAGLAAGSCEAPAVSLAWGNADPQASAEAVAALFAAGATRTLGPLYAARAARPVDIWRERAFITSPCDREPAAPAAAARSRYGTNGTPGPPRTPAGPPPAGQPESDSSLAGRRAAAAAAAAGPAADPPAGGDVPCQDVAGENLAGDDISGEDPAGEDAAGEDAAGEDAVEGVAPWLRCSVEELRQPGGPLPGQPAGRWRVRAARQPFARPAWELFAHDPDADVVLAVLGDLADAEAWPVLLAAAREAAGTGRLVVITPSAGLGGFCASLHSEQPALGITLIRPPDTVAGLRAARPFATAEPGTLTELVLDDAGRPHEPVMTAAEPAGGGTYPLGPADVVLVSGMTNPDDLACAGALGYRGAALAVLWDRELAEDPGLSTCLAGLRAAGRRIWCETADLADAGSVAAAVEELETGLGPVTAVVHGIAGGPAAPCARLTDTAVRAHLTGQIAGLASVLAAVPRAQLRLLVTFGSAAGRCGQPERCLTALASETVAEYAARRAAGLPGCRSLHVAWPPWPGPLPAAAAAGDPGAASGKPPGLPERSLLLRQLLASPDLPGYVAVHGRADAPAEPVPAPAAPRGRFLEAIRVHHPGVELVADARLGLGSDPYLADYQVDGLPVLPAVLALEAMAQAASAVAGEPLRAATAVSLAAPVVVPGQAAGDATVIRVCALRSGDRVETVLRCAETGFRVDHARAVFRAAEQHTAGPAAAPGTAVPGGSAPGGAAPGTSAPGTSAPETSAPGATGRAAAAGQPAPPGRGDERSGAGAPAPERRGFRPPGPGISAPGGIVDGTDLYGPVCFQSGRLRRVAFLPEVSSRSCRALVRGSDDQPWFGPLAGPADAPLILGSPGLNDAAFQVIQACLPHRRVLPAGCESVMVSGREVRGALQVHAVRRPAAAGAHRRPEPGAPPAAPPPGPATAGPAAAARGAVPEQAAGPDPGLPRTGQTGPASGVWDVIAVDATGEPVVAWAGVRLRDLGPLARTGTWHPALLAVSLESRAIEFGLDPSLRVLISTGHPLAGGQTAGGGSRNGGAAGGGQDGGGAQPAPETGRLAWTDTARGHGPLDGFELRVRAATPVAARWAAVGCPPDDEIPASAGLARLRQQLLARPGETPASVDARLRAISASLAALGTRAGRAMAIAADHDSGWVVLRAGHALLASAVIEISGVPGAAALAIAGGPPPAGRGPRTPPGQPGLPQPVPADSRP